MAPDVVFLFLLLLFVSIIVDRKDGRWLKSA
jgi:hypothetical protein